MQVDLNAEFLKYPQVTFREVRGFFEVLKRNPNGTFYPTVFFNYFQDKLSLNSEEILTVALALVLEGYLDIERRGNDILVAITTRGHALGNARATSFKYETCKRALDSFMERVPLLPKHTVYEVKRVVLFGSFANPAGDKDERFGDVDVAVEMDRHTPYDPNDPSVYADPFKPWQDAWKFLKKRSPVLAMHDYESNKDVILNGPYRVLFGDPIPLTGE